MKVSRLLLVTALSIALVAAWSSGGSPAAQERPPGGFTVDDILSLPQPDNLVASPVGSTLAWTFNERGARNIYVAGAPDYAARRLTTTTRKKA